RVDERNVAAGAEDVEPPGRRVSGDTHGFLVAVGERDDGAETNTLRRLGQRVRRPRGGRQRQGQEEDETRSGGGHADSPAREIWLLHTCTVRASQRKRRPRNADTQTSPGRRAKAGIFLFASPGGVVPRCGRF